MKRKVGIVALAVLIAAGAGAWFLWKSRQTRDLVFSGTIEARDVDVGSLVGGRVEKVHVDEGSSVKAGQPIVTLEPDLLDRQIREQEARVGNARAGLTKTLNGPRREETERARVEWQNAEKERVRQEALLREGLAPQQLYDNAAAAARMARQSYDELARGNRPEDIAAARAASPSRKDSSATCNGRRRSSWCAPRPTASSSRWTCAPAISSPPTSRSLRMLEPAEIWVRVYVPEPQLGLREDR